MSGKYERKNNASPRKKSRAGLWIGLLVLLLIAAGIWAVIAFGGASPEETPQTQAPETTGPNSVDDQAPQNGTLPKTEFALSDGLSVTDLGAYTGAYMEDGSDELVTDVMRITVVNNGDEPLQYAEITLSGPAGDALFKLSTLMPGDTAVVLEANRKTFADGDEYTECAAQYVAYFQESVSLQEDKLQIQSLGGGFNITNISGEDISGEIVVYFKDYTGGVYYGGITYRGRIEGGLKAGEIKQIMSDNFSADGTRVVFITIAES